MATLEYKPGNNFVALAATEQGKALWAFLNSDVIRLRMRTASDLGRPAVEGIEEQLLERFGANVLDDRNKQMIGQMTRQVMECEGYVLEQSDVKIIGCALFTRGTRYRRADGTIFHAWQLTTNPMDFALTIDKLGLKLPELEVGEWKYWRQLDGPLRATVLLGLPGIAKVREDIAAQGYHLHRRERLLRPAA